MHFIRYDTKPLHVYLFEFCSLFILILLLGLFFSVDIMVFDFLHFVFFQEQYIHYCWKHYVDDMKRFFVTHFTWTKSGTSVHSPTDGHSNTAAPLFMPPRPPCCCLGCRWDQLRELPHRWHKATFDKIVCGKNLKIHTVQG